MRSDVHIIHPGSRLYADASQVGGGLRAAALMVACLPALVMGSAALATDTVGPDWDFAIRAPAWDRDADAAVDLMESPLAGPHAPMAYGLRLISYIHRLDDPVPQLATGQLTERAEVLPVAWRRTRVAAAGGAVLIAGFTAWDKVDVRLWPGTGWIFDFRRAHDKRLHFLATASLTMSVSVVVGSPEWGMLAAMLVGLGKEVVWDHLLGRGQPSMGDMVANVAGIGFAFLSMYVAERF